VGVVITSESTTDVNCRMLRICPHSSNGCLLSLMRIKVVHTSDCSDLAGKLLTWHGCHSCRNGSRMWVLLLMVFIANI